MSDDVPASADGPSAGAPSRPTTVLVAEDNQVILEVLSELLETEGYRVLVARDGLEAVNVLIANQADVDLAVLDVAMPQLDGLDAFEKIREVRPNLPTLFSTAQRRSVLDVLDPLPDGVGIIEKPYRLIEFLERVREALDEVPKDE